MKTLEQVIMDASKEWCAAEGLSVEPGEAVAIAEAVRGWMREQNEGLRGVIFDLLLEELPINEVTITSSKYAEGCVDAILSVIPPQEPDYRSMTWAMPEEDDAERSKRLAYRLEILERENADLRKRLPDPATLQTEMEKWQASRIKELEDELQHLESNLMVGGKVAQLKEPQIADAVLSALRAKVAKYDELRAKFPFLVGDEFYGALSKRTLVLKAGDPVPELKIYRRTVDLFGEKGVIDTNGNSWTWDEMHPTADACRAAIPVEE